MVDLKSRIAWALAPHDRVFFDLLETAAARAVAATDALERLVHFFPSQRESLLDELRGHADEADRLNDTIGERLGATFVIPLEREDLQALAAELNEVVRSTYAVAALLDVYAIDRVRHPARRLTQLLSAGAIELDAAIGALRDRHDLSSQTRAVRALAGEGEELRREGLRTLFAESAEAVELIRWKDLFDRIESALLTMRRIAALLDPIARRWR